MTSIQNELPNDLKRLNYAGLKVTLQLLAILRASIGAMQWQLAKPTSAGNESHSGARRWADKRISSSPGTGLPRRLVLRRRLKIIPPRCGRPVRWY